MFIKVTQQNGKDLLVNSSDIAEVSGTTHAIITRISGDWFTTEQSFDEVAAMLLTPAYAPPVGYHMHSPTINGPAPEFAAALAKFQADPVKVDAMAGPFKFGRKEHQVNGEPVFFATDDEDDDFGFTAHAAQILLDFKDHAFDPVAWGILYAGAGIRVNLTDKDGNQKTMTSHAHFMALAMAAKMVLLSYPSDDGLPPEFRGVDTVIVAMGRWLLAFGLTLSGEIIIDGVSDAHTELRRALDAAKTGMFSKIHAMPF